MRSNLVFGALAQIDNRYQLCRVAAKATRMLHKPRTRLQDTANEVLIFLTRLHDTRHPHRDLQSE